jgi:hypothetical protein
VRCLFFWLSLGSIALGAMPGPYAPAAGEPGSTAIRDDDARFRGWATGFTDLVRGPQNIKQPAGNLASFGVGENALGAADASQSEQFNVVSLGDGGRITLTFAQGIGNGPGADFAVFENGFDKTFLELAFVEVSSDGTNFFRFPAFSLTQTTTQTGSFGAVDPTNIHNLAGKYEVGYGVPFDLADLGVQPGLDLQHVTHVRMVDVIGIVEPAYASRDSQGRIINDPWPTTFESGGFDLDAVGVINLPEPGCAGLLLAGAALAAGARRRRR